MHENRADSEAMRMSDASASDRPAPTAAPFTAAITGCGIPRIRDARPCMRSERSTGGRVGPPSESEMPISARSAPEQNPRPSPVRMSTRTSGNMLPPCSSDVSRRSSAFITSGRHSVSTAVCSSNSSLSAS